MSQHDTEKLVFLAYVAVFEGPIAQIRKRSSIKKVVLEHKTAGTALLQQLGRNSVVTILQALLKKRVFESQDNARIEFPELFTVTPARAQQRSSTQAQVTQIEAELLHEIASQEDIHEKEISSAPAVIEITQHPDECFDRDDETVRSFHEDTIGPTLLHSISPRDSPIPSLYPLYLPYQAQHGIFVVVQRLLEQACYEFSLRWFPELLAQKEWQCCEAIELHKWTQAVANRLSKLPSHCFVTQASASIEKTLIEANKIRHTAVHRLHTSIDGLLDLLRTAVAFTLVLRDNDKSDAITRLLYELESKAQALTMNKNFLEQKVEKELDDIAMARNELLTRERNLLSAAQEEDLIYSNRVGNLLVDIAHRMCTDASPMAVEDESSSGDECYDDAVATQDI